jgi:hypothetical protein
MPDSKIQNTKRNLFNQTRALQKGDGSVIASSNLIVNTESCKRRRRKQRPKRRQDDAKTTGKRGERERRNLFRAWLMLSCQTLPRRLQIPIKNKEQLEHKREEKKKEKQKKKEGRPVSSTL